MTFEIGQRVRHAIAGTRGNITVLEPEFGLGAARVIFDGERTPRQVSILDLDPEPNPRLTNGDTETTQTFAMNVNRITNKLATMLIEKNQQYSNSALDPIRVFSKADRMEQLRVRADDKLSRIRNGDTSEDAVMDLCGYLILMKIAEENA